ncbi:MAG: putative lipid II flippase FtsW [Eubacterium sp.]|nr:putative lipid II flippase FtsW [Eubacterium sp.]MDD7209590.1 putative peptidoglycan glycosyltransferase FtsW [Lachnospiraceae bacterium]
MHPHVMDYSILFLVLFLVGFGLVILYSTSSYKAGLLYSDTAYWLKKQAVFAVLGILCMLGMTRIDYHFWKKKKWFTPAIYFGTIAVLLFTFVFGALSHGSRRWLSIGPIRFQPSEVAKMTLTLFLAAYISKHAREMRNWKGLIKPFLMSLVIVAIVGIENLSTCIILLAITFIMLFVASPLYKPFVGFILAGLAGAGALILTQGYRVTRFKVWLDPASSPKGEQTMQGLYAIGSGGLFGKGLGQSMQKLGFLPEANNDMIFSVICEELGLFGAICVIALFFALLWRFMKVIAGAPDLYGSMIVVGVMAHIGIQVFINIAVATNTIPNTGIPLPFISYGGSSLVFLLIEMGLVLSVSRYSKRKS